MGHCKPGVWGPFDHMSEPYGSSIMDKFFNTFHELLAWHFDAISLDIKVEIPHFRDLALDLLMTSVMSLVVLAWHLDAINLDIKVKIPHSKDLALDL